MFNRKTHYEWPFSMAILNYQRLMGSIQFLWNDVQFHAGLFPMCPRILKHWPQLRIPNSRFTGVTPSVICSIAIENGHWNSELSQFKNEDVHWFSIVMLVCQRVPFGKRWQVAALRTVCRSYSSWLCQRWRSFAKKSTKQAAHLRSFNNCCLVLAICFIHQKMVRGWGVTSEKE